MIKEHSVILAPMASLSHAPLRIIVESLGEADYYYSEMISAKAYLASGPNERYYLSGEPKKEKMIYQLVGGEAAALISAAEKIDAEEEGAGVDVNMGCSAFEITRHGAGVSWMKDVKKAAELVRGLRKAVKNKSLSVKIRTGVEENEEHLMTFVRAMVDAGVDFIAFHGRVKKDGLAKRADWSKYAKLKEAFSIPIIANGDIKTYRDYKLKVEKFHPHSVMIGRALAKAPWFIAYIRARENGAVTYEADVYGVFVRMCELMEEMVPKTLLLPRLKKFAYYYSYNLMFQNVFYNKVNILRDYNEAKDYALSYFENNPSDKVRIERE